MRRNYSWERSQFGHFLLSTLEPHSMQIPSPTSLSMDCFLFPCFDIILDLHICDPLCAFKIITKFHSSLNWVIFMIYWDRGLAWYDSAFGTQRSRIQISPVPPLIIILLSNYYSLLLPSNEEELEKWLWNEVN